MIKTQSARFLFRPISGPDRAFMASSSFSRGLHALLHPSSPSPSPSPSPAPPPTHDRFPSLGKVPLDTTSCGFRINAGIGLTLKGCIDPPPRKRRVDRDGINTNINNNNNAFQKAKAFAALPYPPHLVRDLEIGLDDDRDPVLANGRRGASHRGSPLGFPDHPLPEKIIVAVDVDEVLGNFVSALNRFIADHYSLNHSVSEYHVYEFFKIWNCSRDEADIRVHEFFKTPYFKTGIHPIPGAQQTLHKLSRFCNLSVVTSRQNAIRDHTIEWIEKHFPGLFQEIHFGNHFALDGESRPKSEICRSLGAKVLIDDNPRYAIECAEIGIRVLLFDYENSYPWCKTEYINQHPLVTKVHNWEEVEQQLVSWIVS